MKKLMMTLIAVVIAIAANAQYNTNYYNQYGSSIGSSSTRSNYGGGYTTNYYNQYGGSTGSSTTRSNYGGGYTTNYYNQYGRTNTVEVPVALPHALTMEVVQQPTTMTSTVAVLARQLPVKTIVVEQLRPITTLTETASGQVTVRVTIGNR